MAKMSRNLKTENRRNMAWRNGENGGVKESESVIEMKYRNKASAGESRPASATAIGNGGVNEIISESLSA